LTPKCGKEPHFCEKHGLHVALSSELAVEICNAFPWDERYSTIPELRDARVMVMD
jgi:hypothetical protein